MNSAVELVLLTRCAPQRSTRSGAAAEESFIMAMKLFISFKSCNIFDNKQVIY